MGLVKGAILREGKEVKAIEIEHLFRSVGHNYYGRHGKGSESHELEDCEELECVAGRGVVGDRFFDYREDYKGQITLFDGAVYDRVKEEFGLGDLWAGAFRRNVILRGVDLNELIGARFWLGEVELSGSEEARPCYWMDEACAPGVEEFLRGWGGLRCRILTSGVLSKGVGSIETGEHNG